MGLEATTGIPSGIAIIAVRVGSGIWAGPIQRTKTLGDKVLEAGRCKVLCVNLICSPAGKKIKALCLQVYSVTLA